MGSVSLVVLTFTNAGHVEFYRTPAGFWVLTPLAIWSICILNILKMQKSKFYGPNGLLVNFKVVLSAPMHRSGEMSLFHHPGKKEGQCAFDYLGEMKIKVLVPS